MYNSILVAYDGSPAADRALKTTGELARLTGAHVTVVHVLLHGRVPAGFMQMADAEHMLGPDIMDGVRSGTLEPDMDEHHDRDGKRRLGTAFGEHLIRRAEETLADQGITRVDSHFVFGDAAQQIVNIASTSHADLIVMGSRGLGEVKGLLLGSVSHKVLQLAECACLTVK
ncbi:MAG TPA: universal stress protein [Gammaproteobacteria bacterium]|nr:universal stress protein [Gammaproteobacteria bacterium]